MVEDGWRWLGTVGDGGGTAVDGTRPESEFSLY
jgi:hypothetical protein